MGKGSLQGSTASGFVTRHESPVIEKREPQESNTGQPLLTPPPGVFESRSKEAKDHHTHLSRAQVRAGLSEGLCLGFIVKAVRRPRNCSRHQRKRGCLEVAWRVGMWTAWGICRRQKKNKERRRRTCLSSFQCVSF